MEDIKNFIKWLRETKNHSRDFDPGYNETWDDCTEEDDFIYLKDLENLYNQYLEKKAIKST